MHWRCIVALNSEWTVKLAPWSDVQSAPARVKLSGTHTAQLTQTFIVEFLRHWRTLTWFQVEHETHRPRTLLPAHIYHSSTNSELEQHCCLRFHGSSVDIAFAACRVRYSSQLFIGKTNVGLCNLGSLCSKSLIRWWAGIERTSDLIRFSLYTPTNINDHYNKLIHCCNDLI